MGERMARMKGVIESKYPRGNKHYPICAASSLTRGGDSSQHHQVMSPLLTSSHLNQHKGYIAIPNDLPPNLSVFMY